MDLDDGLVAAAAALGGVLLTLLGEWGHRRWTARRQWHELRHRAYAEFVKSSGGLYEAIDEFADHKRDLDLLTSRFEQLRHDVDAGQAPVSDSTERLDRLRNDVATATDRLGQIEVRVQQAHTRLEEEAGVHMRLVASDRVMAAARSHLDVVRRYNKFLDVARERSIEPVAAKNAYAEEYHRGLDAVIGLMRRDLA